MNRATVAKHGIHTTWDNLWCASLYFLRYCKRKLFTPHFVFNLQEHQTLREWWRERAKPFSQKNTEPSFSRAYHREDHFEEFRGRTDRFTYSAANRERDEQAERASFPLTWSRGCLSHRFIRLITSATSVAYLKRTKILMKVAEKVKKIRGEFFSPSGCVKRGELTKATLWTDVWKICLTGFASVTPFWYSSVGFHTLSVGLKRVENGNVKGISFSGIGTGTEKFASILFWNSCGKWYTFY